MKKDTGIFTLMLDMPARTCTWVQANWSKELPLKDKESDLGVKEKLKEE